MQDDYFIRFLESHYDSESNSVRIDPADRVIGALDDLFHQRVGIDRQMMKCLVYVESFHIYLQDGYESTEEWFANRYGVGYTRAEEFVWVALTLEDFPRLEKAYTDGELSYDHLRALSRVLEEENEQELIDKAKGMSVGDTFRMVRKIAKVSAEDSQYARYDRYFEMNWDLDRRCLTVFGMLPEEQGAKFEKAINALARKMPASSVDGEPTPASSKRADALCELADGLLATFPAEAQVVIHVDAETLETGKGAGEIEGGCTISPETVERLCCDSLLQTVLHNSDGKPIGMGRARRCAPPRVKREILYRDGRCRYPGCRRKKGLRTHHIVHWTPSGPTDYDNLVMLCETHHYLVHEGGFTITGEPPDLTFHPPRRPPIKAGPPPKPNLSVGQGAPPVLKM